MFQKEKYCEDVGIFGCKEQKISSELDKYGIVYVSYFKILKSILIALAIIIGLNLFLYIIYGNNLAEIQVTGINSGLYKTTIGNIAACKIK